MSFALGGLARHWALACAVLVACGHAPAGVKGENDSFAELRRRVATDRRDRAAHRDLGRIYATRATKGAALRHLLLAGPSVWNDSDREKTAALLLERASVRLEAGDFGAIDDIRRVVSIGERAPHELARRAYAADALRQFRRGDASGLADGRARLAEMSSRFGRNWRAAATEPDIATVADLGRAALWLETGGAKRAALDLFRRYEARGGRDGLVLLGLKRMSIWWGQKAPDLPAAIEDEVVAHLNGWLRRGNGKWLEGLQVRAAALTAEEIARLPRWSQPSVFRARGEMARARAAREAARSDYDRYSPEAQAVVLAELAINDPDGPLLPPPVGELSWLVIARARSASVRSAAEIADSGNAPPRLVRLAARAQMDLAALAVLGDRRAGYALARLKRFAPEARQLVAPQATPQPGLAWLAPPGAVDPLRLAEQFGHLDEARGVAAVVSALGVDPALAERRAREWIEAAVAPHGRSELIVELFARAGDPARASAFAEALLATSREHPTFLELAAVRAAATGNDARAGILASQAAARSGDAGLTLRVLASEFLSVGANLAALSVARRSLSLSAPMHDGTIRVLVARAMLRLGRRTDAAEILAAPSVDQAVAATLLHGPRRASPIAPFGDPRIAARWNRSDPTLLLAVALRSGPASPLAAAQLASIALYRGRPSDLTAWAALLDRNGQSQWADAVRRAAQNLSAAEDRPQ